MLNVGVVGVGAIGSAVVRALQSGIKGCRLACISDPYLTRDYGAENVDLDVLVARCDLIVECLPADQVPQLARLCFDAGKDIVFISSAALLLYPDILKQMGKSRARGILPSGALCGLDGVVAMREMGIRSAKIASTKPPKGFSGAPFVIENNINVERILEKTLIFEGNALEAARGFPANVNVAATLSLAGIGAEKTRVEVWADPLAVGNMHEISVQSAYSILTSRIENEPDPANPKSSVLAAQSIVATLRNLHNALVIG